ncbi:MAG: hypothetical protein DRN61_05180 [Thaumarchaeota archaeon]|nr:MAG: hypothetical protein DRN61_05180 [Nitrososphaerota archaeon]
MNRGKAGISPVMATVILVAIAIVIAIAVAFWATGLVGIFTRFEKLEITAAVYDTTTPDVELRVRNTGSSSATIDDIYVNGVPLGLTGVTFTSDGDVLDATNSPAGTGACQANGPCTLAPGEDVVVEVANPPGGGGWTAGVTYEVAVHTASGKTYPAAVLIT